MDRHEHPEAEDGHSVQDEQHQQMEAGATEEEHAAAAAAAAAQVSAAVDLGQLAALEIPQLVDYSTVPAGQPNLMPAITTLIMQITQHLSNPSGNPQLALTFQPLVNMALNMQLSAAVPDMSAVYNLSSALATAGAATVAHSAQVQFDPQVLMASATAAAGYGQAPMEQPQKRKGSGGRRKQQVQQHYLEEQEDVDEVEEEDDEDWSWKHKTSQRDSSVRPQRQRKKSKLLQEYLTDDEEGLEPGRGRRAAEY